MTPFERGWRLAITMWRDGITWEGIVSRAKTARKCDAPLLARGMLAAADAMTGWEDVAVMTARVCGLGADTIEGLLGAARRA